MGLFIMPASQDANSKLEAALSGLALYRKYQSSSYDYLLDHARAEIDQALLQIYEDKNLLDSTMSEFCPERMTRRQKKEFKKRRENQRITDKG